MHIAGTTQGAFAPLAPLRPFDPVAWLSRYIDLGGSFTANRIGACIHRPRRVADADLAALAAHELQLSVDPGARRAVKAYLTSLSKAEVKQ